MKLSIYVNLRSIAWIITELDKVIDKGIKKVHVEFDNYYEFIAGLPVSKRINRRLKRQARRNLSRYHSRREHLKKYLNVTPAKDNPLELRVKALSEKLTPEELATVFLPLQKNRGYKNMRGLTNCDKSEYLNTIKEHEENLKNYQSIAEYLLNIYERKNVIFTRESHEKEFDLICQVQGINDEKLRNIIYYQRPLKRGKIGNCKLEKNKKVCHYSHPDYQEFRIWRDVMNIVIKDTNNDEVEISNETRKLWIGKLMKGQNITKASCCKDLGISKSTGYSWMSGKNIIGNIVFQALGEINEEKWQDIFSATDDSRLLNLGMRKYDQDLTDINFTEFGWGEYSHKAIIKLLPELTKFIPLKEAILNIYGIVDMTADITLRNLIVEQHYASYISLINAIKKEYEITEIAIEISHLLKAGNKMRKEIAKNTRAEKKNNTGLSDYQNHLLKLYKEFKGKSPYEPEKEITEKELFENYNVDHIVPKSKLFEHGYINQCLCRKDLNEQKGSLTGLEFAKKIGIETEYCTFIDNLQLNERKKSFLLMETSDISENYIKTEDYITKCFLKSADYVIPNKIINKYYKDWKLDIYPENDIRESLMKCLVIANFGNDIIEYFNNLKNFPNTNISKYDISQAIFTDANVIPYMPRTKYYRKTKFGYIPRHQLHEESTMGLRKEYFRDNKGKLVFKEFYKIRKSVTSLTPAMIEKIIDKPIYTEFKKRLENQTHEELIADLAENPIIFNNKPVKSVSIKINAHDLIKLERGYVYSAINHRFEPNNKKVIRLHDYINDLNKGIKYIEIGIKKNDIIEYNNEYYFVIGANNRVELRNIFELNATKFLTNNSILKECKLLRVNELGKIKSVKKIINQLNLF